MIEDGLRQTTLWDPGKMLFPTRGNQNPIQSGHGCSLIIIEPCSDLFNLDMDAYMDILHGYSASDTAQSTKVLPHTLLTIGPISFLANTHYHFSSSSSSF